MHQPDELGEMWIEASDRIANVSAGVRGDLLVRLDKKS